MMRNYALALLGVGLVLGTAGQASATIYDTSNGTTTLPGTNVGTVGSNAADVSQIGDLALYNGGSGGSFVNTATNPSNYEFYFAGGSALTIEEEIGNNGIGDAIGVNLDSWNGATATTLDSITIPYSSGPSVEYTLASDDPLSAGDYIISTYLATGNVEDPNYQVNFTESSVPVPEPASLAVLGAGLFGLGMIRRRKSTPNV